jgi:hypothetical protein
MDSAKHFQVDVLLKYSRIGPLSLRERAGVRVTFAPPKTIK